MSWQLPGTGLGKGRGRTQSRGLGFRFSSNPLMLVLLVLSVPRFLVFNLNKETPQTKKGKRVLLGYLVIEALQSSHEGALKV